MYVQEFDCSLSASPFQRVRQHPDRRVCKFLISCGGGDDGLKSCSTGNLRVYKWCSTGSTGSPE